MSAEQGLTEVLVDRTQPNSGNQNSDQQNSGQQNSDQQNSGHQNSGTDEQSGSGGYELDEDGQRVPHGMGQSKSSRRRRRKRKGKTGDGPVAQGSVEGEGSGAGSGAGSGSGDNAPQEQVIRSMQAGGEVQPVQQDGQSQNGPQQINAHQGGGGGMRQNSGGQGRSYQNGQQGGQQNGAPGGTKRWKKKNFRDRNDRPRQDNPGSQQGGFQGGSQGGSQQNGGGGGFQQSGGGFRGPDTHQPGNGGSGFKRKSFSGSGGGGRQQRGPRAGFVGPMDHSYRAPNGNVFDTPSTMDSFSGNGGGVRPRSFHSNGDSQPIDYSQGRAIPIAEGTPTKIYFFIEDLFFTAKIQETARKLGVKVAFVKNDKEQIAALTASENEDHPGLIVFDLNNANAKPLTLIPKLKTKLKKTTSIIGFLSHLQGDLKAKAVEAGCDTVMPRAAFSQNLPNLLRRYGIEDTTEQNYNQ